MLYCRRMVLAKNTVERKVDKLAGNFEKLTETVSKLAGAVERGFAAVADDIADSKKATLEGFVRIEERLNSIEQELKDIKRRLTVLEDRFDRFGKISKREIEELWKHIAAIEKQLKMQR